MKKEKIRIIKLIIFIVSLILVDRISKILAINYLKNDTLTIIKNFFELSYVQNIGAAFGILSGQTIILILISIGFIIYMFIELKKILNDRVLLCSFILIISGSIGNLIDRFVHGYVIDFISFRLFGINMPVFNIADMFITFGALIYIYKIVRDEKNERD